MFPGRLACAMWRAKCRVPESLDRHGTASAYDRAIPVLCLECTQFREMRGGECRLVRTLGPRESFRGRIYDEVDRSFQSLAPCLDVIFLSGRHTPFTDTHEPILLVKYVIREYRIDILPK